MCPRSLEPSQCTSERVWWWQWVLPPVGTGYWQWVLWAIQRGDLWGLTHPASLNSDRQWRWGVGDGFLAVGCGVDIVLLGRVALGLLLSSFSASLSFCRCKVEITTELSRGL